MDQTANQKTSIPSGTALSKWDKLITGNMITKKIITPFTLAIIAFAIFFLYRGNHLLFGDNALYAYIISIKDFDYVAIHTGYYLLGYLFHHLFSFFVDISVDKSLILMSNIFGVVGVVFTYLLSEKIIGNKESGKLCALIMLFSGTYLFHSIHASIYVIQTAFIMASMYFFYINRNLLSGTLFSFSVLLTPGSIFVGPFYVFAIIKEKKPIQDIALFVLGVLVVYLPIFALIYKELLWGTRGLLVTLRNPVFSITEGVNNWIYGLLKSFNILFFFMIIGLVWIYFRRKDVLCLTLLMFLPQIYLMTHCLGFQALAAYNLQIYIFFVILISFGLQAISEKKLSWSKPLFLIAYIVLSLIIWIGPDLLKPHLRFKNAFQNNIISFNNTIERNKDYVILADWGQRMKYLYYSKTGNLTEQSSDKVLNLDDLSRADLSKIINQHKNVYVIESYSPSFGAKIFLSQKELDRRYREHSMKSKIEGMIKGIQLSEFWEDNGLLIYKVNKLR